MGWTLVVSGRFLAGHRFAGYDGIYVNVHVRMWRVEVAVRVDKLDSLGMGVDFRLLKGALNRILDEFEHAILVREGDIAFRGVECVRVVELPCNPTAEVIAAVVYSRMKGEGWNVEWVRVWEGENAYVEFREG